MRPLVLAVVLFLLWVPGAYAWTWPVEGPVLLGFVFDPSHPYAAGQHRGIDIGASTGTPVVAPASGTVSFAGTVPTSGKSVTIATADGYSVTLTHLGSIDVDKGTTVNEGGDVGTVGPSGTPELDVPYLYMGVRVTANPQGYLDPLSFLPPLPPPVASSPAPTPPPPLLTPSTSVDAGGTADAPSAPPAASPPDTTTTSADAPSPDAAAAAPDTTPDATSTPASEAGDVSAPADTPAPTTSTDAPAPPAPQAAAPPPADAAPADGLAAAPSPTPDATSATATGAGDVSAAADPPMPATISGAPAPPPAAGDAPPPVAAPEPVAPPAPTLPPPLPHATIVNPDPGFDPTAPDAPSQGSDGAPPVLMPALDPGFAPDPVPAVAAGDDVFVVHATPPAAPAVAVPVAAAAVRLRPSTPAIAPPIAPRPRAHAVPRSVSHAVRRVPVVVPVRRRHPAVPFPPSATVAKVVKAVVVRARHGRVPWPIYLLLACAAAAVLKGVRMISSSSKTSEGAHPVAVAEDPRRGRVAVRERATASGPCRRPGRAVRHLRALSPAQGQRRPHGERDGRARHAGDGVGRPGRRVAS
jgi:hypothetical protein